ncbi:MAG: hypothetical protein U9N36_11540 [Euryarchaeota archaeon]|nr:hypothetical protein [Euryarchaeota archaeon]
MFSGLVSPSSPTAVRSIYAKVTFPLSPPTSSAFARIHPEPLLILYLNEKRKSTWRTSVTWTTAGLYVKLITPPPSIAVSLILIGDVTVLPGSGTVITNADGSFRCSYQRYRDEHK